MKRNNTNYGIDNAEKAIQSICQKCLKRGRGCEYRKKKSKCRQMMTLEKAIEQLRIIDTHILIYGNYMESGIGKVDLDLDEKHFPEDFRKLLTYQWSDGESNRNENGLKTERRAS